MNKGKQEKTRNKSTVEKRKTRQQNYNKNPSAEDAKESGEKGRECEKGGVGFLQIDSWIKGNNTKHKHTMTSR